MLSIYKNGSNSILLNGNLFIYYLHVDVVVVLVIKVCDDDVNVHLSNLILYISFYPLSPYWVGLWYRTNNIQLQNQICTNTQTQVSYFWLTAAHIYIRKRRMGQNEYRQAFKINIEKLLDDGFETLKDFKNLNYWYSSHEELL